jgi:hypothetical protein
MKYSLAIYLLRRFLIEKFVMLQRREFCLLGCETYVSCKS